MRKYLMQHSLKAFTILLPRNFEVKSQRGNLLENDFSTPAGDIFVKHFANFIKTTNSLDNLPSFNFLATFYDVEFVEETEELFKFHLVLNETLNKSIWLRLKHLVFNQYNVLIGFSDVLKEVETLDDTDRLLIQRINSNARDMYKNTKLLMEFEELKFFNFELKSGFASPIEYLLLYLRNRRDKEEIISFKYNLSEFKNVTLNIDNEYFKTSLNLLFDLLKETVDLSNLSFQLQVGNECVWSLEYENGTFDNAEFINDLQAINDFYGRGIDITHLNSRMFHLLYIRLIVEKLGGEFKMVVNEFPNSRLLVEWIFPIFKKKTKNTLNIEKDQVIKKIEKTSVINTHTEMYPIELRREIAHYFLKVDGAFVLDDWKVFADKLDNVIVNYKASNVRELKQIVENIRSAVSGFDITALQLIMTKLYHISKTE